MNPSHETRRPGRALWWALVGCWFVVQVSNVLDRGPLIGVTEYATVPFGRWRMFTTYPRSLENRRLAYIVTTEDAGERRLDIQDLLHYHDFRRNPVRGDQNFCLQIAREELDRPGPRALCEFIEREFARKFGRKVIRLAVYVQTWECGRDPANGTTRLAVVYESGTLRAGRDEAEPTESWALRWPVRWGASP